MTANYNIDDALLDAWMIRIRKMIEEDNIRGSKSLVEETRKLYREFINWGYKFPERKVTISVTLTESHIREIERRWHCTPNGPAEHIKNLVLAAKKDLK